MSFPKSRLPGISRLTKSLRQSKPHTVSTAKKRRNKTCPPNKNHQNASGIENRTSSDESWEEVSFPFIESDIRKENERLEAQVLRLCYELKEIEKSQDHNRGNPQQADYNGTIPEHVSELKVQVEGHEKQIETLIQEKMEKSLEIQDLREQMWLLRNENEELKKDIEVKNKHIHSLTMRLSSEMGTKLSTNETYLQNISIQNGPHKLADEYHVFTSTVLLDAKNYLDQCLQDDETEENKYKLLCDILTVSEAICRKVHKRLSNRVIGDLRRPFTTTDSSEDNPDDKNDTQIPLLHNSSDENILHSAITDYLRKTATFVKTDMLHLAITTGMDLLYKNQHTNLPHLNVWPQVSTDQDPFSQFIDNIALMTWKMALQRPQMSFDMKGIHLKWKEHEQEVHWTSDDPQAQDSRVRYYIHPALYHGNILMTKGKVYIKNNSPVNKMEQTNTGEDKNLEMTPNTVRG